MGFGVKGSLLRAGVAGFLPEEYNLVLCSFALSKATMPWFKQAPFCLSISKLTDRSMIRIGSFPSECSHRIRFVHSVHAI